MPQQTPLFNVILLAAGGFFMFVCMDSTAKYLGTVMPVTQAIWGRFFFHLVSLVIFFLIFKPKVNLKKNFKFQIIRSILMVTATSFMFYSLQKFDLVDIYVVFFTAPLIVSLLSAYFLKGVVPEWDLKDIYYGMMQFMVLQVIGLILIVVFPQIALWLPTLLYGQ